MDHGPEALAPRFRRSRSHPSSPRWLGLALVLFAVPIAGTTVGCGGEEDASIRPKLPPRTLDLPEIRQAGDLRILVEADDDRFLPRRGDPLLLEREVAREFAAGLGLQPRFVAVERFADLLPALLEGRGDLVAANMTVTPERLERVDFTAPVGSTHEVLVLAAGRPLPATVEEFEGTIGARDGTSFLATARALARGREDLRVVVYTGALSNEDVLDSLVAGRIDATIQDNNRLDVLLDYREGIRAGPQVTATRPLAWAVRPDNPRLRQALDAHLHARRLLGRRDRRYVADLGELKELRRIRMITRNNAATYFLWRGRLMGFEYELARRFAERHDLRLEVVVAPRHDDLLPMLLAGEGDFVAAFLTRTAVRDTSGVAFSRPYHWATEVVVGRADEVPLAGIEDLAGRRIAVRRSSSYWEHLQVLREREGVDFELVEVPGNVETEALIAGVAEGRHDLTVADSHLLELEMTVRDDVQGLLQLGERREHVWAVHPRNEELLAAIDAYFDQEVRSLHYNLSYQRYFERPLRADAEAGAVTGGGLSPYDSIVRELAPRHGFDWRLIVAQMYQESRFDPEAESWAGAQGLMQVLPRTAAELGVEDPNDPWQGIEAGLRYMDWVWDRFPDHLSPDERTWFTLAGYNAGHGHVRDARRLARRLGLDADRWFGNVERAMLRLSEPEFAQQARHGYVRGLEPVNYVREIRDRYRAYVDLLASRRSPR